MRCGGVCARKESGSIYDEVFPQQRQAEARSLFNGAAGSHEAVCLGECVQVGAYAVNSDADMQSEKNVIDL